MNTLNKLFDFYIESSIHVAISVVMLVVLSCFQLQLTINYSLLFFVFFATITGYNFVKYASLARLKYKDLKISVKAIQIFSFFSFVGLLVFSLKLPFRVLLLASLLGALTLFYAIPLLKNKNLRAVAGLKIFIVALVWAGTSVLLPVLDQQFKIGTEVWLLFVQRILFVLVLILPFEIRDVNSDTLLLKTIPQRIGVQKTKVLGLFFLSVVILLEGLKKEVQFKEVLVTVIVLFVTAGFLLVARVKQTKYFSSFWVESIPVLWVLLWCLLLC